MSKERLFSIIKEVVNVIVRTSDLEERVSKRLQAKVEPVSLDKGVVIVAIGKGAVSMAKGALRVMGEKVVGGVVAVPLGTQVSKEDLTPLEVVEGSHPVPDERSEKAAEAVIEWAKESRQTGGLIALISGGGSAIVEKPLKPLSLDEIVVVNRELLRCGASIREINTVRRHLSAVKGGRVALIAHPAPVLGLYASDVPGDKVEDIASGPTAPDPTTYADAIKVITIYGLKKRIPREVMSFLERGARGEIEETPKPSSPVFRRVRNEVVAKNLDVLNSLEEFLRDKGFQVLKLTSRLEGESREVAKVLASIALESIKRGVPMPPPLAILLGGETAVTVKGRGRGGRNQEVVVAWALRMNYWEGSLENSAILAIDTDGIDGITDAAGGYMFPSDIDLARARGLDPTTYLIENDTYTLLKRLDRLVVTGPTGSNLNSVIVVLIDKD